MLKVNIPYGIDAPIAVRNLFLFALLILIAACGTIFISSSFWFWVCFSCLVLTSFILSTFAFWMLYSSLFLKPKLAKNIIESLHLQHHESLLDVGCGRGLFLIEAAKQLSKGKVCGIDLWDTKDQSGNSFEATNSNVKAANFDTHVELFTGNMCYLPFPDESFDNVISSLAIHNVPNRSGRNQALLEILRVLKPGGKFVLLDFHYAHQYFSFIREEHTTKNVCISSIRWYFPPLKSVSGIKRKKS